MSPTVSSLLSLVFVLALIPVSLWDARRFQAGAPGSTRQGPIRIRATVAVGPRERIVIVEAAGKSLLVGITGQSMQTLAEFQDAPIFEEADAPGFATLLKGIRRS